MSGMALLLLVAARRENPLRFLPDPHPALEFGTHTMFLLRFEGA